jgi:Gpi18-like mannosyltransferase
LAAFAKRPFFGRVSVTSGIRPIAIALALLVARHLILRRPHVLERATASWAAVRATPAWRATWPVFVSTRLGILLVGFFGIALLGYAPNTPPWRVYENDFLNLPARWDTGWYVGIAERGYQWDPAIGHGQQNIAFFPAFPIITHYAALFLGRNTIWAGVLVSLLSFLIALQYLFRFAREKLGGEAAHASVAFIATYPFALFFSTAYTESLFLLAAVAACYHFERDELGVAALWGLLAGLSRPNGCLLSVVLALIAMRDARSAPVAVTARRVATAAMPGIGMLIFSAHIYSLTGNPLQWAANHEAYGRVYKGVFAVVTERIEYVRINGLYNYVTVLALDLINLLPVIFAAAAIVPVYRRLGAPYAAMIVLNVVLPVLMGGVLSMGRVTSTLFPLFLWLAVIIPRRHRTGWLVGFAMAQALFAIAFFTWRPLV